ncbi:MAG: response regulator [Caulobacteraceae bacterium]|nr:MAG: response regulator [Caulobacteraceae bacterium]
MTEKGDVHVIDDDDAMRDSLAFMLDMNGYRSVQYETADDFLSRLPDGPGGCVVADVRMPGTSGVDLARLLTARGFAMPIVIMTGHGDIPLAVEAMKAGAVDFVEKPFSDQTLLTAVRTALDRPTSDEGRISREAMDRVAALSPRERDVLVGVVAGKPNKVIAFELGISIRTVEIYRANMMAKTGSKNMSDLMRTAMAAGL